MGILVSSTDFESGSFKLPLNDLKIRDLDGIIANYEIQYLQALLGVELTSLFIADLTDQVPTSSEYLAIYNEIKEDYSRAILYSAGMKPMIQGFICAEYLNHVEKTQTTVGTKTNNSANAETGGAQASSQIYNFFNQSVDFFRVIQWYICDNSDTYPSYNGQDIEKIIWL